MARENMEEWGTNVSVEHETIRAVVVVEAYGKGQITLPVVSSDTNDKHIRYAPSFIALESKPRSATVAERPYTAKSVAEFIGWINSDGNAQEKVIDALGALELIEMGLLKESDVRECCYWT